MKKKMIAIRRKDDEFITPEKIAKQADSMREGISLVIKKYVQKH